MFLFEYVHLQTKVLSLAEEVQLVENVSQKIKFKNLFIESVPHQKSPKNNSTPIKLVFQDTHNDCHGPLPVMVAVSAM